MTNNVNFEAAEMIAIHTSLAVGKEADFAFVRVAKIEKLEQDDANTYVRLNDVNFHNGVIEVDVCGKLLADAPPHARGFIGIVFRANEGNSEFESFYIRPANGRDCDDPVRKSHACQYFSFPGYTFSYFREFGIDGYEASIGDIALGEWSHIRAEVYGQVAVFFVNGREVLRVNDLKHGSESRGAIGLYVDIGTDGFFRNLTVQCDD